jgi:hypothetical protein
VCSSDLCSSEYFVKEIFIQSVELDRWNIKEVLFGLKQKKSFQK